VGEILDQSKIIRGPKLVGFRIKGGWNRVKHVKGGVVERVRRDNGE